MKISTLHIANQNHQKILTMPDDLIILNHKKTPLDLETPETVKLPKGIKLRKTNNSNQESETKNEQKSKRSSTKIQDFRKMPSEQAINKLSKSLGVPSRRTIKRKSLTTKLNRTKVISDVLKFEVELKKIEEQIKTPDLSIEERRHAEDLKNILKQEDQMRAKLQSIMEDFGGFLLKNQMIPNNFEDLISKEYRELASRDKTERLEEDVQVLYEMNEKPGQWKTAKEVMHDDQKDKELDPVFDEDMLLLFMCQNLQIDPKILKKNKI